MFIDYYKILDINPSSNIKQVKNAYKRQALRWHPDRNQNDDTTSKMQDINEAYLILNDPEARKRYDNEYNLFMHQRFEQNNEEKSQQQKSKKYNETSYEVDDDILRKWMENARNQAIYMAKKSLEELISMTSTGLKAGVDSVKFSLGCLTIIIILILIALILKSIN